MTPPSDRPSSSGQSADIEARRSARADALRHLDDRQIEHWGRHLAGVFRAGGRLLTAGNGGSAAEAQHLASELVGRFRDEREPFSAIALTADSSTVTAIANDFGFEEVFARQVRAHGRPGDVLLLLSASGRSTDLLRAAEAGRLAGLTVWALTGAAPNPLTEVCHESVVVLSSSVPLIQECHLAAVHHLCEVIDTVAAGGHWPDDVEEERILPLLAGQAVTQPGPTAAGSLVVVGDALLDRDLSGTVRRVSPEAPVPVVDDLQARLRPGGAGLAAVLGARSGRAIVLVTALSPDENGSTLRLLLEREGVEVVDLGLAGPTPVKSRVRSAGQSLLMLSEAPSEPSAVIRAPDPRERLAILQADAILVSDYGGGIARSPAVRAVVEEAVTRIPVVWDVHPRGAEPVSGVRLVTPNSREAGVLSGAATGDSMAADIERAGSLLRRWKATSVAVTRGAQGAILVTGPDSLPLAVPTHTVRRGDTRGAGDCFAVTATALLADGQVLSEAVGGAVRAATAYVTSETEDWSPGPHAGNARPFTGEALRLATEIRASGGTVVATAGCFDILHAGHVAMLAQARALGDCLIVCLNDDDSVRRLKGQDRPIVPSTDRAAVLAALSAVDAVVTFHENRPDRLLGEFRPDVYVKGGDYRLDQVLEAELVSSWGGQTILLPYLDRWSTTGMINKIVESR